MDPNVEELRRRRQQFVDTPSLTFKGITPDMSRGEALKSIAPPDMPPEGDVHPSGFVQQGDKMIDTMTGKAVGPAPPAFSLDDFRGQPQMLNAPKPSANIDTPTSFFEGGVAGFKSSNDVYNIIKMDKAYNYMDENFDLAKQLDADGMNSYMDTFLGVRNQGEYLRRKRHLDDELARDKVAQSSPFGSFVGSLLGGFASPTIFLPGSGVVKVARAGGELTWGVSRSAMMTAGLMGAASGVQELALHTSQVNRENDVLFNIGFGMVLGGLVGGGAAAIYSRAERKIAERATSDLHEIFNAPEGSAANAQLTAKAFNREDLNIAGKFTGWLADKMSQMNPGLRLNVNPILGARVFGQQLAENTVYQVANEAGRTLGPAAETTMQFKMKARLGAAMEEHNAAFKETNLDPTTKMSRQEFNTYVAIAMRNEDNGGGNMAITKSAKGWRKASDEIFAEAKAAGIIPMDIEPKFAASYLSRIYNKKFLLQDEHNFKRTVMPHIQTQVEKQYGKDVERANERIAQRRQEIDDMKLTGENRVDLMTDLEMGLERIRNERPETSDILDKIEALGTQRAKADREGDFAKKDQLKGEMDRLREEHKDKIKELREAERPLKLRQKNIEKGFEATEERADALRQSLADLEELNVKTLNRLLRRGQRFERELQKIAPDKLEGELTKLQNEFGAASGQFEGLQEKAIKNKEKIDDAYVKAQEAVAKADAADTPNLVKLKAQAEEARKTAEKVAPIVERLRNTVAKQDAAWERMQRKVDKVMEAQQFDPMEVKGALKEMNDALVDEVASITSRRTARGDKMYEKLQDLNPNMVEAEIAKKERSIKNVDDRMAERWGSGLEFERVPTGKLDAEGNAVTKLVAKSVLEKPNFATHAQEIVDDVFEKISGRNRAGSMKVMPDYASPITRGPMRGKSFYVDDNVMAPWLENDVEYVMGRYAKQVGGDTALANKFGTTDYDEVLSQVKPELDKMLTQIDEAKDVKEITDILGRKIGRMEYLHKNDSLEATKQRARDHLNGYWKEGVTDTSSLWNIHRGLYKVDEATSDLGRTIQAMNMFNYIRLSGRFLISSLGDIYRPAMVFGLKTYMSEGVMPLLRNLEGVKVAIQEAKQAGLITERLLHHRLQSMMEIGDTRGQGSAIERLLQGGTSLATKVNGMAWGQDILEQVSAVLSQGKINRSLLEGKNERYLAFLGANAEDRALLRQALEKHGEVLDGTNIANTEKWGPEFARVRDVYRAMLSKDVTSIIPKPGMADKPLLAHTPIGKAFFQFQAFNFAANQRVMLRGMQEGSASFLSGLVGATSIGMLVSYLKAIGNGQESYDKWKAKANAGFLIGEGLDNSGMMTYPFFVANAAEKITKAMDWKRTGADGEKHQMIFNPIKSPLSLFAGGTAPVESTKMFNSNLMETLAGPTAGLAEHLVRGVGSIGQFAMGEPLGKSQMNNLNSVLPYGQTVGLKEMIHIGMGNSPWTR